MCYSMPSSRTSEHMYVLAAKKAGLPVLVSAHYQKIMPASSAHVKTYHSWIPAMLVTFYITFPGDETS